ncbi:hypothetical protein [Streptomyces uncialis]|uniref:hypothetical protein n=1 Tax=Streptomyces uncialis TaxID=1048205 RepID=UPI0038696C05|nr:hypothetical protein OG268_27355 [Streptomyces uncialis]
MSGESDGPVAGAPRGRGADRSRESPDEHPPTTSPRPDGSPPRPVPAHDENPGTGGRRSRHRPPGRNPTSEQ